MKNIQKYSKEICAGVLFLIGVCSVVFGESLAIQGGLTCACWSVAVLIMAWIDVGRNQTAEEVFDYESREILRDIAEKGVDSEYYMHYDIDKLNSLKAKMLKRQRKQLFSFIAFGVILLIIAILCVV